jgi:hypothetical protein
MFGSAMDLLNRIYGNAGVCVERLDVLAIVSVLAVNNRKGEHASPHIMDSITPKESASLRENKAASRYRPHARLRRADRANSWTDTVTEATSLTLWV